MTMTFTGPGGEHTIPYNASTQEFIEAWTRSASGDHLRPLVEFLLARIDEDEGRCVSKRIDPRNPFGQTVSIHSDGRAYTTSDVDVTEEYGRWVDSLESVTDPRVLAECGAKRAIIALHGPARSWDTFDPAWCNSYGAVDEGMGERAPCRTLRALSLAYAGHPEYRDEWRPEHFDRRDAWGQIRGQS